MKQKIEIIKDYDNSFTSEFIELDVPRGTKILSNESYTKELFEIYMDRIGDSRIYQPINNDVIDAKVSYIGKDHIQFDIGAKQEAYSAIKKENPDTISKLTIGTHVKIKLSVDNNDIKASLSDAVDSAKVQDILDSIGKPAAFHAKVKSLVHGGYMIDIDGIEVFMPGSLAGMNKLWDFESLIGKDIIVMPINYSNEKNTIVVSRRAYLETILSDKVSEIKNSGNTLHIGNVTGTSKFGVFVEFNECITGLLMSSDLTPELKSKFDNSSIKPGESISFMIKEVINDKKIMLTQVVNTSWDGIEEKFPPSSIAKCKVTKIRNYGAFLEICEGVVGMLHESEFKKDSIKEGDTIDVKIQSIDSSNKRIVLKLA